MNVLTYVGSFSGKDRLLTRRVDFVDTCHALRQNQRMVAAIVEELKSSDRYTPEAVAEIVADLELSERLGLEILELGAAEPANKQEPVRFWTYETRRVNLVTGESYRELSAVQV